MRKLISTGTSLIQKNLVLVVLLGIVFFYNCFAIAQPADAAVLTPEQAKTEIQKDLAEKDRGELYKDEVKIIENPKVEIEKEYEENVKDYFEDKPDKPGLIKKVEEFFDSDEKK